MQGTRRDWVIVTDPANEQAKLIIAESPLIPVDGKLAQACLKGIVLAVSGPDFVMVDM